MEIDGQALQWQTLQILQWIAPSNSVKGLEQIPSSTIYTPVPTKLISLCAAKGKHLHFLFIFHHLLLVNPWMTANMPFLQMLSPAHTPYACMHLAYRGTGISQIGCPLPTEAEAQQSDDAWDRKSCRWFIRRGGGVWGFLIPNAIAGCRWVSSVCPTRGKC